jgi:hypothetical protein
VGVTKRREDVDAAACGDAHRLVNQAALADAGRPDDAHNAPLTDNCLLQGAGQCCQFPLPPHQTRLPATDPTPPRRHAQETPCAHRCVTALDLHRLRIAQHGSVSNQPGGGRAEHHRARLRGCFHPLRHPDLLTDRGVTQSARTDLTRDDLTRVQADPHLQIDTVASVHFGGQPLNFLLNARGCQTRPESMVLQRDRRPEHRHDAVAGELVHRAAAASHHRRGAAHELGHDLAQPLCAHRRGHVHRMHHVGEQHGYLLVLSRLGGPHESRTALYAELGRRA